MNNLPLVSIIIPTYNHAHLIKNCLESVKFQSYQNWEAIIINNFSNDNTIEVVDSFCKSDSRIKLINFNNNGVIAASRNKGISVAAGKYIALLDSDDSWYQNKLQECLAQLQKNDFDIIFHNLDFQNENGMTGKTLKSKNLNSPVFIDLITHGNLIFNSSVVVKKELIDAVGGLNEEPILFGIEDCDLWIRISKITENFLFIDKSLGRYWISDQNNSKPSAKYIERYRYLYSQYVNDVNGKNKSKANAFLHYAVTRQKHKCGQLDSSKDYFKTMIHLDLYSQKFKALCFGILRYFKKIA